ncbi:hypothetical protein [Teredinibacter haidensis]|uniref:hypothetical protein n=1 Tax=Teredinibacter haidensis TaxID=2731755 RepID=UPI00111541E8|nr:hypothetical protein [Teredinibacter haidensis]
MNDSKQSVTNGSVMPDTSFSKIITELSNDYYNRSISLEEYRSRRRDILDEIDTKYNGFSPAEEIAACTNAASIDEVMLSEVDVKVEDTNADVFVDGVSGHGEGEIQIVDPTQNLDKNIE